jgi:hypothetical protein
VTVTAQETGLAQAMARALALALDWALATVTAQARETDSAEWACS